MSRHESYKRTFTCRYSIKTATKNIVRKQFSRYIVYQAAMGLQSDTYGKLLINVGMRQIQCLDQPRTASLKTTSTI